MSGIERLGIERLWHKRNLLAWSLWPLSLLFGAVVWIRRKAYRFGILRSDRFSVPIIVVGGITVGATGKTPLLIWLAGYLRQRGLRPGIVSRGHGGRARHWPQQVRADSDAAIVGDEAVLLAARTGCPMSVGPDRPAAVAALLEHTDVNLVISDDGLQHYALHRDLEIAVIDGGRRFGNGFLLPAGPLREPVRRLRKTDLVIVSGTGGSGEFSMRLYQPVLWSLDGRRQMAVQDLKTETVHAVAGIDHPERFFGFLRRLDLSIDPHPFPDHHPFQANDLAFEDGHPVLMTEKDAVKCRRLPCPNCWVVQVDAQPDAAFVHRLALALEEIIDGQKTARHPGMSDL
jgi:tetraacyldisaccharide 4'-kinase